MLVLSPFVPWVSLSGVPAFVGCVLTAKHELTIVWSCIPQVRKIPSWPRSWTNFSVFIAISPPQCMRGWANFCIFWANLLVTPCSLQRQDVPAARAARRNGLRGQRRPDAGHHEPRVALSFYTNIYYHWPLFLSGSHSSLAVICCHSLVVYTVISLPLAVIFCRNDTAAPLGQAPRPTPRRPRSS